MAAGADGTAYALWPGTPATAITLQIWPRSRPAASGRRPVDVAAQPTSTADPAHAIGADDDGDVAVVAPRGSPSPLTVAVSALDAAGPSLT